MNVHFVLVSQTFHAETLQTQTTPLIRSLGLASMTSPSIRVSQGILYLVRFATAPMPRVSSEIGSEFRNVLVSKYALCLCLTRGRGSSGRVVKLLTCGAREPGFDSRPRHLNFQRLVISCFQVEIWLKDR